MIYPHENGQNIPMPFSEGEWQKLEAAITFENYLAPVFDRVDVAPLLTPVSSSQDEWEVVGGSIDHAVNPDFLGYDLALLRRIGAGMLEKYRIYVNDGYHILATAYDKDGHTRGYRPTASLVPFAELPEPVNLDHYTMMGIAIDGTTFSAAATHMWAHVLGRPHLPHTDKT